MENATRNRLIIAIVFLVAAGFIAYEMYFSLTPPRHADHDHAIAKLNAGGFLWLEAHGGERRNMVGKPGAVLLMHWFDPTGADLGEQRRAALFAERLAGDPMVDILFVAQASSWDGVDGWLEKTGIPAQSLYLDVEKKTGELFGVRRQTETLIYDPTGLLAYQAMGPADWSGPSLAARIENAKAGVEEIH